MWPEFYKRTNRGIDDRLTDTLRNNEAAEDRIVDEGEAFYNKDLTRDSNDDSEEV